MDARARRLDLVREAPISLTGRTVELIVRRERWRHAAGAVAGPATND